MLKKQKIFVWCGWFAGVVLASFLYTYLINQVPPLQKLIGNVPTPVVILVAIICIIIVVIGQKYLNVEATPPDKLWCQLREANQKLINDRLKNSLDQDRHIPIPSIDSPDDLERPQRKAAQQSSATAATIPPAVPFHQKLGRKLRQIFQPPVILQKAIADKFPQIKTRRNLENLQTEEVTELSPNKPILEIFKEANGRLLILGESGSGKTTELLKLAQALGEAAVAENNPKDPIPLIFELSTWRGEPMFEWMVGEIVAQYVRKQKLCREWLKGDLIVPLLDGLDELGKERAKEAVREINALQADYQHQQKGLVISCRVEDYESLTDENNRRIRLKGVEQAVRLCELADDQIKTYLEQRKAEHIWDELQSNSGLMELARNPMLLNLMPLAYPDELPDNLSQNPQDCQSRLFDDFLDRKLSPRLAGYDPEKAKYYLAWLAASMGREDINQREFLIERLQPTWLETQKQRNQYSQLCRCMFGIIVGLVSSMIGGLIPGVISGLIGWLLYDDSYSIHLIENFNISWKRLNRAIFLGLIGSLIGGLVFGLMSSLIGGLIFGLMGALIGSFIDGFIGGLIVGLVFGIRLGLIVGLIVGIIAGLKTNIKVIKHPKQVIINTGLNAMIIMALTIILFVLSFIVVPWTNSPELILKQSVIFRVLFSAFFGYFIGGGEAFTKYFILREVLCHHGRIPRNYVQFLNEASACGILKQSGGRYRFYHDKLREHLASTIQLKVEPVSPRKKNKFFGWFLSRR